MNFMTWDRMVSIFPSSTFCDHVAFPILNPIVDATATTTTCFWLSELRDYGFIVAVQGQASLAHCGPRNIRDSMCWTANFDGRVHCHTTCKEAR